MMESLLRGLLGVATVLVLAYTLSLDRRAIAWKTVVGGLALQLLLALSVIYVPQVAYCFELIGRGFLALIHFVDQGLTFLFGPYFRRSDGFSILFHSLPLMIFLSALVSLLFYWGVIQRVVRGIGWVLRRFMPDVGGCEGLVTGGNIFLGMTESPLLITHYLPYMNRSEIFVVMVSGFGTIAGSIMGVYISILGSAAPAEQVLFAKHLLTASLMAAPASIVIAKMICPQTETSLVSEYSFVPEQKSRNWIDALVRGAAMGVRLLVNVAAVLLVFVSLVAMVNYVMEQLIGTWTGLNEWAVAVSHGKASGFSLQFLLGLLLAPLAWLLGVPADDMMLVGSLMGVKTILNELVAYLQLRDWMSEGLFATQKSILMATYLLCGFANLASIGIFAGGLSLLAPDQRDTITRYGFLAMVGGALVSCLTAAIMGMMLG